MNANSEEISQNSGQELIPFDHRLFDKKQVADYFNVNTRTIEAWMRQRHLPYVKIGKTVRFKGSDLLQALERHRNLA